MNIREIENYGLKILQEKAKDGSMTVYAKFSEAEKRNQNSRIYPLEILSREVDRVQSKIASGQFLGQSDHSLSPQTFLKDVSHVVTKLEMIGNDGFATIKILNTSAGRNCQEIIRGKGRIGISTRSVGTISATGVVQKDLRLLALDLVSNPSVADATIGQENILEGIEFEATYRCFCVKCGHTQNAPTGKHCTDIKCEKCGGTMRRAERPGPGKEDFETQRKIDLEESINDLEKESYLGAVESGFKGDENLWHRMYGGGLREMVGLPVSGREIPVQELTPSQISVRTHTYFLESCASGFTGSFDEWKEKYPRLVALAGEKVVVEKKEAEPKVPFKSRTTWNEVVASGFRGTIAEWQEQYPNIEVMKPETQKPAVEKTLKERAGVIFAGMMKDNPKSSLVLEDIIKLLERKEIAKADKRLRKRAIYIVNASIAGSGSVPTQEMLKEMVETEIENLKERRQEMREKNWQIYKKLLSE